MRLLADNLPAQLSDFGVAVLIAGEELLLLEEALDRVRVAVRSQGFSERETFVIENEKQFDFDRALESAGSLSLFASRRVIEWRFLNAPGELARKAITQLLARGDPDTLLLIIAPGMNKKALGGEWLKELERKGTLIVAEPVALERLQAWLQKRAQQLNLSFHADALQRLADTCEGNLLAAQQSLQLLVLMYPQQTIAIEQVIEVCITQARFDVYDVVDTAFSGDAERLLRMLHSLREEDDAGYMRQLVPALQRDLRSLAQYCALLSEGVPAESAATQLNIWFKRKKPFASVAKRLQLRGSRQLLRASFEVERVMKGASIGDVWQMLERILLRCAGRVL